MGQNIPSKTDERSKRTVFLCRIIKERKANFHKEYKGVEFELINPFGKQGSGINDPQNVMIIRWLQKNGATYVYNHLYGKRPKDFKENFNEIEIRSKCGQSTTFNLKGIDENQDITEVTIRGEKYIKA